MLEDLHSMSEQIGLKMNKSKQRPCMINNKLTPTPTIQVEGQEIESVQNYLYLGQLFSLDGDPELEIKRKNSKDSKGKSKLPELLTTIMKQKWKWAWHVARMNANWAHDLTMQKPCQRERNRGRPKNRWAEEIHKRLGKWRTALKWRKIAQSQSGSTWRRLSLCSGLQAVANEWWWQWQPCFCNHQGVGRLLPLLDLCFCLWSCLLPGSDGQIVVWRNRSPKVQIHFWQQRGVAWDGRIPNRFDYLRWYPNFSKSPFASLHQSHSGL